MILTSHAPKKLAHLMAQELEKGRGGYFAAQHNLANRQRYKRNQGHQFVLKSQDSTTYDSSKMHVYSR